MNALIGFVVILLVLGLLFWCVQRLIQAYKITDPLASVIIVVFALLVCAVLLAVAGRGAPWWPL